MKTTTKSKQLIIFFGDYMDVYEVNSEELNVVDLFNEFRESNQYCKAFLNLDYDDLMDVMLEYGTQEWIDDVEDEMETLDYVYDGMDVYILGSQTYFVSAKKEQL